MFWECMTTLKTTSKGVLVRIKVSVEGTVMVLKLIAQHVPTTALKIRVDHFQREQVKKMIAVMVLWDIMIILMYGRIALSDFSKNHI